MLSENWGYPNGEVAYSSEYHLCPNQVISQSEEQNNFSQSPFELGHNQTEVPQYYSESYEAHRVSVIGSTFSIYHYINPSNLVGNVEHSSQILHNYQESPHMVAYGNHSEFFCPPPPQTYKRKPRKTQKEKKKTTKPGLNIKVQIYFQTFLASFTEIQKTDLTPDHKNGIHLWQFLLSLLRQPKFEKHIKWLDRNQGMQCELRTKT